MRYQLSVSSLPRFLIALLTSIQSWRRPQNAALRHLSGRSSLLGVPFERLIEVLRSADAVIQWVNPACPPPPEFALR